MSRAKLVIAASILSLVACVVGGLFLWSASASADSDALDATDARYDAIEAKLQATDDLLEATEERLSSLQESYESSDGKVLALEKQMKSGRIVRQCLKEVGQQAQGMSVEYGYASPYQRLSAPCSSFVFDDNRGSEGD